jgi:hypothetical protein
MDSDAWIPVLPQAAAQMDAGEDEIVAPALFPHSCLDGPGPYKLLTANDLYFGFHNPIRIRQSIRTRYKRLGAEQSRDAALIQGISL